MELAEALNDVLSAKWGKLRGIEIVSFGVSSVKASEEDEQMLKGNAAQRSLYGPDPRRCASCRRTGQRHADRSRQSGRRAPAMAFMGMNMAGAAGGMNAQGLYQMGAPAAGRRTARSGSGSRSRRLDLQLRPDRQHRQILRQLRQPQACPGPPQPAAGYAAAAPPTPASSAVTAAAPSPHRLPPSAASAAGPRMTRPIRPSSARSAVSRLASDAQKNRCGALRRSRFSDNVRL